MFYSRKLNNDSQKVEVWECEWSNKSDGPAKKIFKKKIGDEEDINFSHDDYCPADAVCWAPGRTIGNIAVSSEETFGSFEKNSGDDAILPCQIIPAGKFRHGASRWYCKTHQVHWGTKADFSSASETDEVRCSNHSMGMSYVVNPLEIEFKDFVEIGIWCSLPQALSSKPIERRSPRINVHKRFAGNNKKSIDRDFDAIVCSYNEQMDLFENREITKIQVTPPAAFEFIKSIEEGRETSCITCRTCGYPHLDLGDFANTPHRKHFCGNCGSDTIWSKEPIVSTPLKPLHDQFSASNTYISPNREVNLDDYDGLAFDVWASTPAVLWTADRAQEKGIHVHVYGKGKMVVDDTFGKVIYSGKELDREELWQSMVEKTIY